MELCKLSRLVILVTWLLPEQMSILLYYYSEVTFPAQNTSLCYCGIYCNMSRSIVFNGGMSDMFTHWTITRCCIYYMIIGNMFAIAVDEVHGLVYWSDDDKVKRATLDGSNQRYIYNNKSK